MSELTSPKNPSNEVIYLLLAEVGKQVDENNKKIDKLDAKVDTKYVTVERYQVVEKLVYGQTALILIAAAGAVLKMVMR